MTDIFSFPTQYKVCRQIGKEDFLRLGNLTEKERCLLSDSLECVWILYDLMLPDRSEMMVLSAELSGQPGVKKQAGDIARTIASALPYKCVLLLERKDKARLYTFEQRENGLNTGRSYIERMRSTKTFSVGESNETVENIINGISILFPKAENVLMLEEMWNVIIDRATMGFAINHATQSM